MRFPPEAEPPGGGGDQMLIDCHTHCFPDILAQRSMAALSGIAGITPFTDGTAAGLLARMDAEGVDRAVLLHIATKPKNQNSVNRFAAELRRENDRFLCFGSVHPAAPDAVEELSRIRELGLRGVKLHPDYQGFFAGDSRAMPVYREIGRLGLPLTFHMGFDPYSPSEMHASPAAVAAVARAFPELTIIAAHMGGLLVGEEVLEHLCGLPNVYLDTSMSCTPPYADAELYRRILDKHGTDRVLFGSDCPWSTPARELDWLRQAGLSDGEMEKVTHENAERLFGL